MPLSVYLHGEYNHKDVFIGVPAVINRSGIRNIIEIPLSDAEQEKMDLSATTLKKVLEEGFASLEADAKYAFPIQNTRPPIGECGCLFVFCGFR